MQAFLRADINFYAAIMLGALLLNVYKALDKKDPLNKAFIITSLVVLLLLIIEAATVLVNRNVEYRTLSIGLHIILFISAPVLSALWVILFQSIIIPKDNGKSTYKYISIILVSINAVLAILSSFYNLLFYIDSQNVYMRGNLYYVSYAITYGFLIVGVFSVLKYRKSLISKEVYLLILLTLIPIIGGIFQAIFYGLLTMWSSVAITLVMIYIFIQERLIHLDPLTGVWTRKSFMFYINRRIKKINDEPFGGIYFDIDQLKLINDQYGHDEGDKAINGVIDAILKVLNPHDIIARLGGDEFIIVTNTTSLLDLEKIINSIHKEIQAMNISTDKSYQISVSFGYGLFSENHPSIEAFLRDVDLKMYEDKKKIKE